MPETSPAGSVRRAVDAGRPPHMTDLSDQRGQGPGHQVTLLRLLVNQRRLTREEVRRCLVRRANRMQIHQFSIERRQLDRWLNGEVKRLPHPSACRVLEAEFGHPPEQLLAFVDAPPQPVVDIRTLVTSAAAQSVSWARQQDSLRLGELALEGLRIKTAGLATDYVHRPMVSVFGELVALRDELLGLLSRPDPRQASELYFLAGVACGILGHASGNLGYLSAANDQTQTAIVCAEQAGHPTLSAWATGVRALQSEWNGRPRDSLSLVARAQKALGGARTVGTTGVWLAAIEARAWARLGHRDAATEALATAVLSADQLSGGDDLDSIGGVLNFPPAKQQYYAAVVSRRCGDLTRAQQYAQAAVAQYESGPAVSRSYGDEALARVELALARAAGRPSDLEGAVDAVRVLRDLTGHTRLAALAEPLGELGLVLSSPKLRAAAPAAVLRHEVRQLLAPHRPPRQWTH